ncbi:hypothetical protein [Kitasatospora sp. NPDC091207]|uniref:hypothetical protein n=1 Tax=Kitasatospora sp. NPDC091207 TaxID=3364083 RepID=UPI00381B6B4B
MIRLPAARHAPSAALAPRADGASRVNATREHPVLALPGVPPGRTITCTDDALPPQHAGRVPAGLPGD